MKEGRGMKMLKGKGADGDHVGIREGTSDKESIESMEYIFRKEWSAFII